MAEQDQLDYLLADYLDRYPIILIDVVKKLLDIGSNPNVIVNDDILPPLHNAVSKSLVEVSTFLLDNKADPNLLSYKGKTALHCAYNFEMVELLLSNGADPLICDSEGNSLLHRYIDIDTFNLLLRYGLDPFLKNKEGGTSLSIAVRDGRVDVIKAILDIKNVVNDHSDQGSALLHRIYHNIDETVELLLSYGADINVKNNKGKTVLYDLSDSDLYYNNVALLLRYGADPSFSKKSCCYNYKIMCLLQEYRSLPPTYRYYRQHILPLIRNRSKLG